MGTEDGLSSKSRENLQVLTAASCLFQHLQRFLQCSTCHSHSHSPMPCMATSSPPRQVINTAGSSPGPVGLLILTHFTHLLSHIGFLQPSGALSLQKQMEHANQQTGFSDSVSMGHGRFRGGIGWGELLVC